MTVVSLAVKGITHSYHNHNQHYNHQLMNIIIINTSISLPSPTNHHHQRNISQRCNEHKYLDKIEHFRILCTVVNSSADNSSNHHFLEVEVQDKPN